MKREILFRGQTRRKGERVTLAGTPIEGNWVYGGIFYTENDFSVIYTYHPVEKFSVYSDTVGQYTGLIDKNGVKIFEDDIIKHYNGNPIQEYSEDIGKVFWHNKKQRYLRTSLLFPDDCPDVVEECEYEVIGNIYDNPEFLEKNNEQ